MGKWRLFNIRQGAEGWEGGQGTELTELAAMQPIVVVC